MNPQVEFLDGSFSDCEIRLVHEWSRKNFDMSETNMAIVVIQPKVPEDSHPFTKTIKLNELTDWRYYR